MTSCLPVDLHLICSFFNSSGGYFHYYCDVRNKVQIRSKGRAASLVWSGPPSLSNTQSVSCLNQRVWEQMQSFLYCLLPKETNHSETLLVLQKSACISIQVLIKSSGPQRVVGSGCIRVSKRSLKSFLSSCLCFLIFILPQTDMSLKYLSHDVGSCHAMCNI